MDFTNGEFEQNIERVRNLLRAAATLGGGDISTREIAQDVLRASVVFLHASLEELIRNLFVNRLPDVSPRNLDRVPLAASGVTRPSQILLGSLLPFRGQFVDNVIKKSIDEYVGTFNLNSSDQLAQCLKLAELDFTSLTTYFAELNELMQRRHQIVHQMDRTDALDPLSSLLSPIDSPTVERWALALHGFAQGLFRLV